VSVCTPRLTCVRAFADKLTGLAKRTSSSWVRVAEQGIIVLVVAKDRLLRIPEAKSVQMFIL
jgi:hypothetical protein